MKKELIDFFNTDLQFIKGVGPVLATRFEDILGGRRVFDFMLHKPYYVRARGITDNIQDVQPGESLTIALQIKSHKSGGRFGRGRKRPTQIRGTRASPPTSYPQGGTSDWWRRSVSPAR